MLLYTRKKKIAATISFLYLACDPGCDSPHWRSTEKFCTASNPIITSALGTNLDKSDRLSASNTAKGKVGGLLSSPYTFFMDGIKSENYNTNSEK